MSENEIIKNPKPKDKEEFSLNDLAYVMNAPRTSSKVKRVFLKTIKYKGDIQRALTEEGYSKVMIQDPNRIISTDSWQALMDQYFPKDALMKKEKELWKQPDWRAWANSLDRLHKIRGSFIKRIEHNIHSVNEFRQMDDKQLTDIVEGEYEDVPSESEEGVGQEGTIEKTP